MFSNIVYKFTFTKRKANGVLPFYYIGSKSNCYIKDNKIYDNNHKIYKTSSSVNLVKDLIDSGDYELEILFESDVYDDILDKENEFQINENVVHNDEYFNLSYATKNIFTSPNYVTIKTNDSIIPYKKISKEYFESGNYCGTTTGMKWFNNPITKEHYVLNENSNLITELNLLLGKSDDYSLYGEDNNFYGKKHTAESKKKMVESRRKYYDEHPKEYEKFIQDAKTHMYRVSQLPKSEKFIDQLKDRMTTTLYIANKETGESKRILKDEYQEYKANGWISYSTYMNSIHKETANDITCDHCGFSAKENNSSFYKWHNDKCKQNPINSDQWQPWIKETNAFRLEIYAKLDIIHDVYHKNITSSGKVIIPLVLKALDGENFTKNEIEHVKRMYKKIKDGYTPYNSNNWKKYKEKYNDSRKY